MLVRFVAVALIGLGMVELSLAWITSSTRHTPMRVADFVLPAILLVAGVAALIKAHVLAEWVANKLDE